VYVDKHASPEKGVFVKKGFIDYRTSVW